jgi:hypothetical protein
MHSLGPEEEEDGAPETLGLGELASKDGRGGLCESSQCERNPSCVRGFRHNGRGGHCSLQGITPRLRLKPLVDLASLADAALGSLGKATKQLPTADAPKAAGTTSASESRHDEASGVNMDLQPSDVGFNWKGLVVHVPGDEFGQDLGPSYRGTILKASGLHAQIYFKEDDAAYWFKKKSVSV